MALPTMSWSGAMMSSRTLRYRVVDVFAGRPLEGNPLAVFLDAVGLETATMQAIARELNLEIGRASCRERVCYAV